MTPAARYLAKTSFICRAIEERNLSHGEFASAVGLSRNYWCQVVRRRRHLTPRVRRALLAAFPGVPEDELWDKIPVRRTAAEDAS